VRLDAFMLYVMRPSFDHLMYFYAPIKCLCFIKSSLSHFYASWGYFMFLFLVLEKCLEPI